MAPQLPWELEEEILSCLPPQSLVRFRIVCKRWNGVCKDKTFINNHMSRSRPQFIFLSNSKIYSIDIINYNSIDPTMELRDLPSSPIDLRYSYTTVTTCDEFLFCHDLYGRWTPLLCNPSLRQFRRIFKKGQFDVFGLGYDNSRTEKVYKILCYCYCPQYQGVAIYDCASHAFKFIDTPDEDWFMSGTARRTKVSLNGNLYWFECNPDTRGEYFIRSFDFSMENFKPYCLLPCQKNSIFNELLLAVFKRDRFSLLKQCYETRKIEIWVTNKIHKEEEVVWIKLMTLPADDLPCLSSVFHCISYFIYDKTLFMCCADEIGVPCIYIVRGDLCKKIRIQCGIDKCCHCVYTPNLISVPYIREVRLD